MIKATKFFVHPLFHQTRDGAPVNDVAIVKLDRATCAVDLIDFACLAPPAYPLQAGERCWAAGWGQIDQFGRTPFALKEVRTSFKSAYLFKL